MNTCACCNAENPNVERTRISETTTVPLCLSCKDDYELKPTRPAQILEHNRQTAKYELCPDCSSNLAFESGCAVCYCCGFSQC